VTVVEEMVERTDVSDQDTHRQSDEAREDTRSRVRAKFTNTRQRRED